MYYSHENTVLTWIDDPTVEKLVKKICSSLKLNIYEVDVPTDVYGIPYFFAVIDGKYLNQDMMEGLSQLIKYENPKEFAILLTQMPLSKIPASIKKYFILPSEVDYEGWMKTSILNKHFSITRHKENKKSYDKTIYRVIYILKTLMKKNKILSMDDLCREFEVSERTIKRDFAMLRQMGEDIEYDKERKGYYLAFSTLDIEING